MCGIAGIVGPPGSVDESAAFARKAAMLLSHRGPDGEGQWTARLSGTSLMFSHRRLAIIDLSNDASQPMSAGDLTALLNGEIYNHVELRGELETKGYRFRTKSDTEVLLAAYEHWGADCLQRFSGMFAFVIADLRTQELFLARDPFGIKPLFYVSTPSAFAFASEAAPLLPFLARREINQRRLEEYLRIGTSDAGPDSFFEGISQLPQAHFMRLSLRTWPLQAPMPKRYWRLPSPSENVISVDDAAEGFRDLFLDSVRLHLRSDVPVGVAVSGGIDSSSILAGVRQVLGEDTNVLAFCYEASETAISDAPWARMAIEAAHAEASFFQVRPGEIRNDLRRVVEIQGEPFVNPAVYAQFRLFRECSAMGIKVLLEGQGADEMLGGYPYFLGPRVASLLRRGRVLPALRLARKSPTHVMRQAITALRTTQSDLEESPFRAALRRAIETTTLPSYLRWGDRNAMAWSVENRVPFLNRRIAEFLQKLPEEAFISTDGTTKFVLRRAMKGLVPEPILRRRDKIGFGTPYQSWLEEMRPELTRLVAGGCDGATEPAIRQITLEAKPFLQGSTISSSHARRLWGLLTLLIWREVFQVSLEANRKLARPTREEDPTPQEERVS